MMQSKQEAFGREVWEEEGFFHTRIVAEGMCMEHQPETIEYYICKQ